MMRSLCVLVLSSSIACAGPAAEPAPAGSAPAPAPAPTPAPEPASGAAVPGLRLPPVVPALPEGAIDLGPLLLTGSLQRGVVEDVLIAEAERLGADGFVREGRGLSDVYAIDLTEDAEWRKDAVASTAVDIGLFALTGGIGPGAFDSPSGVSASHFFRAYRVLDAMPEPVLIDWSAVGIDPPEAFATASTLAEQLARAHAMLASGRIDPKAYRNLRAQLVARGG